MTQQFNPGDPIVTASGRRGEVIEVDTQLFPLHTLVQFKDVEQPLLILTHCLSPETQLPQSSAREAKQPLTGEKPTVPKVVTPITAKVVIIGKPKESTYTPGQFYHPVLFADQTYPEGAEEAKIWKNLSSDEVSQLTKGDTVQLVPTGTDKNGKVSHQIVKLTPTPTTSSTAAQQHPQTNSVAPSWSEDQKREVAAYIEQVGALYRYCYTTAATQMKDMTQSEETLRCCASSLFIAAQRKFHL